MISRRSDRRDSAQKEESDSLLGMVTMSSRRTVSSSRIPSHRPEWWESVWNGETTFFKISSVVHDPLSCHPRSSSDSSRRSASFFRLVMSSLEMTGRDERRNRNPCYSFSSLLLSAYYYYYCSALNFLAPRSLHAQSCCNNMHLQLVSPDLSLFLLKSTNHVPAQSLQPYAIV